MSAFKRHYRIGTVDTGRGRRASIYVTAAWDGQNLSISGVVGPLKSGNALGECGQIIMSFAEYDARGYLRITDIEPAPGWSHSKIIGLFDIWDKWHMNDMRPGCQHQMADGWDKRPIDPSKPTTAYGRFHPNQRQDSWNMLAWVYAKEVPGGLLCEPCPICGYKYGSKWVREDVPSGVIKTLLNYPKADIPMPRCWE